MARGVHPTSTEDSNNNNHSASANGNAEQNSHRNRLPLSLPLAIPLYTPPMEEVQQGGEFLFQNFVSEEFQRNSIDDPPVIEQYQEVSGEPNGSLVAGAYSSVSVRRRPIAQGTATSTPEGYKNYDWTAYGRTLRELADEFAQSQQGAQVREQARTASLTDITEQRFLNLLTELFSEGLSRERVIALFYYCTLLLIRSRRSEDEHLTRNLFFWSLKYIRDKICQWVYEHGGWGAVFRNLYDIILKTAIVCSFAVVITCGIIYIRKNF